MRYLALIYTNEAEAAKASQAENEAMMAEYNAFTEDVMKAGVRLSGYALHPTGTATTVRVRSGKTVTTDGPFAETKEQLGGYYLIDCKDLDEAIKTAAKIPSARFGSVEVRPIMEFPITEAQ
jgi:hypothetical protein